MIKDNLETIWGRISEICERCNRDVRDITLVGVTKFADITAVNEAIGAGLLHVAENKVQLAQEKFPKLRGNVTRHMIGHLQTNKVKDALKTFDVIQSVDSLKLVEEIEKRAAALEVTAKIMVQVDIAKEEQKFGVSEEQVDVLFKRLAACARIETIGVMTIAPLTEDMEVIRSVFRNCRELNQRLQTQWNGKGRINLQHLSMGMSNDYEVALEEGANMLRIGAAIFKGTAL